jgi:predicted DNA-binding transcriptional regulator AlpA
VNSQTQPRMRLVQIGTGESGQHEARSKGNPATTFRTDTSVGDQAHGIAVAQVSDRLLTADDVADRLNVSKDWVWDHSSRKAPFLPVIRMGDGTLRYRASKIEEFINERERLSTLRRKRR